MYSVIVILIWEICAIAIIFFMTKETNRRIAEHDCLINASAIAQNTEYPETNYIKIIPYTQDTKNKILLLLAILISGVCAYFVSQNVISVWFCIEMGLCYIAVLGAAIVDGKLREIPNILYICLFLSGIVMLIIQSFFIEQPILYIISSLIGCFLAYIMLTIARKLSKGGVGMGDVKLLCAVGLTTGLQAMFSCMLVALIYCASVMGYLKLFHKKEFQGNLPFAPFLYLGFATICILTLY